MTTNHLSIRAISLAWCRWLFSHSHNLLCSNTPTPCLFISTHWLTKCLIEYTGKFQNLTFTVKLEGRDDIVLDISTPEAREVTAKTPFTVKEGASYKEQVGFTVVGELVSGLLVTKTLYRKGLKISKNTQMMASFTANLIFSFTKRITEVLNNTSRVHLAFKRKPMKSHFPVSNPLCLAGFCS